MDPVAGGTVNQVVPISLKERQNLSPHSLAALSTLVSGSMDEAVDSVSEKRDLSPTEIIMISSIQMMSAQLKQLQQEFKSTQSELSGE